MVSEIAWAQMIGPVFARCGGLLAVVPPINVRQFPLALRLGLAGVLAVALTPVAATTPDLTDASLLSYLIMLLREAALGVTMGFAAALVFWAFLVAGQLLDAVLEASSRTSRAQGRGPLTGLVYLLAAVGFVAMNGHHWMLAALAESMTTVPVGSVWSLGGFAEIGELAGIMLMTGVAVAAPVLAAIYAAEVALAAFDRIVPGLGLTEAAPAVRWTSGLLGLIACLPLLSAVVAEHGLRAVRAITLAMELLQLR